MPFVATSSGCVHSPSKTSKFRSFQIDQHTHGSISFGTLDSGRHTTERKRTNADLKFLVVVMWTVSLRGILLQTFLAKGHRKKVWIEDSSLLHFGHLTSTLIPLRCGFSPKGKASWAIDQKNILILEEHDVDQISFIQSNSSTGRLTLRRERLPNEAVFCPTSAWFDALNSDGNYIYHRFTWIKLDIVSVWFIYGLKMCYKKIETNGINLKMALCQWHCMMHHASCIMCSLSCMKKTHMYNLCFSMTTFLLWDIWSQPVLNIEKCLIHKTHFKKQCP